MVLLMIISIRVVMIVYLVLVSYYMIFNVVSIGDSVKNIIIGCCLIIVRVLVVWI